MFTDEHKFIVDKDDFLSISYHAMHLTHLHTIPNSQSFLNEEEAVENCPSLHIYLFVDNTVFGVPVVFYTLSNTV